MEVKATSRGLLDLSKGDLRRTHYLADEAPNFHGDACFGFRPVDFQYAKVFPEVAIAKSVGVFFFAWLLCLVHGAGGDVEERVG